MRTSIAVFLFSLCSFAAPALASGDGGHGFALKEHGFYIVNFVIFVGILVAFARKPIKAALGGRADAFSSRLNKAREQFDATQARLDQAREKMELSDVEAAALMARVEDEAEQLKATIAEKTEQEERKIRTGARAALENEKKRLERTFQAELALGALAKAEAQLGEQWKGLPHKQFVEDFADALATKPAADGGQ